MPSAAGGTPAASQKRLAVWRHGDRLAVTIRFMDETLRQRLRGKACTDAGRNEYGVVDYRRRIGRRAVDLQRLARGRNGAAVRSDRLGHKSRLGKGREGALDLLGVGPITQ